MRGHSVSAPNDRSPKMDKFSPPAIAGICGIAAILLAILTSLIYGPWMLVFVVPGVVGVGYWIMKMMSSR